MHLHLSIMPSCICIFLLYFHVVCLFLFGLLVFFFFQKKKEEEKSEKYKNSVCLCTLVLVYLGWPLKQNFLKFVSFVT